MSAPRTYAKVVGARSAPVRPKPVPRAKTLVVTLEEPTRDNFDVCELRFRPLKGMAPPEAVQAVVAALEAGTTGVSRPPDSETILQQGLPWTTPAGMIILTVKLPVSLLDEMEDVQETKGGLPVEGVEGGLVGVAFSPNRLCRRKIRVVNVPAHLRADTIRLALHKCGLQPTVCERPRMGGFGFRGCGVVEAMVVARMSDLPDKLSFVQPGGVAFECPIHYIRPAPPADVGAVMPPRTVARQPAGGPSARAGATPSGAQPPPPPPQQQPSAAAAGAGSSIKDKRKIRQRDQKLLVAAAAVEGDLARAVATGAEGPGVAAPAQPAGVSLAAPKPAATGEAAEPPGAAGTNNGQPACAPLEAEGLAPGAPTGEATAAPVQPGSDATAVAAEKQMDEAPAAPSDGAHVATATAPGDGAPAPTAVTAETAAEGMDMVAAAELAAAAPAPMEREWKVVTGRLRKSARPSRADLSEEHSDQVARRTESRSPTPTRRRTETGGRGPRLAD